MGSMMARMASGEAYMCAPAILRRNAHVGLQMDCRGDRRRPGGLAGDSPGKSAGKEEACGESGLCPNSGCTGAAASADHWRLDFDRLYAAAARNLEGQSERPSSRDELRPHGPRRAVDRPMARGWQVGRDS